MNKQEFILKLKQQNPDLETAEIEGVMHLINKGPKGIKYNTLIQKTGIPKQTLNTLLQSIPHISIDKTNIITIGDTKLKELKFKKYSGIVLGYKNKSIEKSLKSIRGKYKLDAKREYDQFFANIKTTVNKAEIINKKRLITGKSIALIGDDDLMSIAICLLSKPLKITVFEIDKDIINLINKVSEDLNLNIETVFYDVKSNILPQYINKYDVVITDPPYTQGGFELFLDRCVSLVKRVSTFDFPYIFIYYGNSFKSPEKFLRIQDSINKYSLVINDVLYKFARYEGAESIGNASNLYVLRVTKNTYAREREIENIYTYQEPSIKSFPYVEHYSIKLLNVPAVFFKSINVLDKASRDFCKKHGLKIIDTKVTKFASNAFTITYILATSNFSIHTWQEYHALHLDLLTCSKLTNKEQIVPNLMELFNTKDVDIKRVE